MTNKDLIKLVNNTLNDYCINKSLLAKKMNISRQAFDKLMNKKNFSIDDANRILNFLNLEVTDIKISTMNEIS